MPGRKGRAESEPLLLPPHSKLSWDLVQDGKPVSAPQRSPCRPIKVPLTPSASASLCESALPLPHNPSHRSSASGMLGCPTVGRSGSTPDFSAMKYRYLELSKMIDHALLSPALTDQEMEEGCRLAIRYQVASVCVKPYAVAHASQILAQSDVLVSCVVGFPHGSTTTASKRHETQEACENGAAEIDMVINVGKALGGDWDYVENEIRVVSEEAHRHGAKIKVILETDYLAQGGAGLSAEELKRELCQICDRAGADWVKTSTGYGYIKQPDGNYRSIGATEHDLRLMKTSVSERVQVKASGGIRDLDGLIQVRDLGATRCGTSATVAILDEYRQRELAEKTGQPTPPRIDPQDASRSTADY